MFKLLRDKRNKKRCLLAPERPEPLQYLQGELQREIYNKFDSKLSLYIIDTGSCGACEIELQNLFNPFYDVSTLGIEVVYDVKKADILLITGLLTQNMYEECKRVYTELNEPKRVITVGDCPVMLAPFKESFAIKGESNIHFNVVHHISGCPPEPTIILEGLLGYLKRV